MKTSRHELRDWFVITAIIVIGFVCVALAGMAALRFAPSWERLANMNSNIDPNSNFLTHRPAGFIAPIDSLILTPPVWIDVFQTPGVSIPTRTPLPTNISIPASTSTLVPQPTNTAAPVSTSTSTLTWYLPPTSTKTTQPVNTKTTSTTTTTPTGTSTTTVTTTATPTATATGTPATVDLQVTKSDGVTTYTPGGAPLIYQVIVTNNSTLQVNGATVTDSFSAQVASASWSCSAGSGATCTASGTGDINDTVNLPAGGSVIYTITVNTSAYAVGNLVNTATVTAPSIYTEGNPGNNSATDSDACSTAEPDIGPPDGAWTDIAPGSSITIVLSPAIIADGDVGIPDLVYYERLASPAFVDMDWVQVEISKDGNTWYQILYWGDPGGAPDTNTNIDVQNTIGDICPTEIDNCSIPTSRLYNNTGITIDVDSLVPPGYYSWMRITSPPSPDSASVDSIQPYYP